MQPRTLGADDASSSESAAESRHSSGAPRMGSSPASINVGRGERALSLLAGTTLTLLALQRHGLRRLLMAGAGGALAYRGITGHSHAYAALQLDTSKSNASARETHVEQAFSIQRSPEELYAYWRDFQNLQRILSHVKQIRVIDTKRSHWVVEAPRIAGGRIEWDAEITRDEPNRCIAWRSLPGASVESEGQIRFTPAPADRGTEVRVSIDYRPPAGKLGDWIATLSGAGARGQIRDDLRNFKRLMECGEILTTEGQPRGTCGRPGRSRAG